MLLTAAIVPGPPAFVPELMGSAAHELDDLRDAADSVVSRVVSDLVAASADSPADSSFSDADPAQLVSSTTCVMPQILWCLVRCPISLQRQLIRRPQVSTR